MRTDSQGNQKKIPLVKLMADIKLPSSSQSILTFRRMSAVCMGFEGGGPVTGLHRVLQSVNYKEGTDMEIHTVLANKILSRLILASPSTERGIMTNPFLLFTYFFLLLFWYLNKNVCWKLALCYSMGTLNKWHSSSKS